MSQKNKHTLKNCKNGFSNKKWFKRNENTYRHKIPRKGGPAIRFSDLMIVNKTDLAPYVGADLAVMEHDAKHQRGTRPFVFTNLKTGEGLPRILTLISEIGGLIPAPVAETT